MKEACGVFGVHAPGRSASRLTFDGLYALQHRGQESAGMAVSDGETITVVKDMGLVTRVFDERTLSGLSGHLAMGHTRYSTHGASDWKAAQPVYRSSGRAGFALGHNGNLTNTDQLAARAGMLPGVAVTDSDLIAELLAGAQAGGSFPGPSRRPGASNGGREAAVRSHGRAPDDEGSLRPSQERRGEPGFLAPALREVLPQLEGAYSLVLLDAGSLYGVRDPHGFRPLCLGRLGASTRPDGWVLASESPALDVIGAEFVREIEPGELVTISGPRPDDVRSEKLFSSDDVDPRLCIFELVYFARPDSRLYGREVHGARRRMGELLADRLPVDADLVMGVPDSGVPAAEGYARRSGIAYGQGLVKNRYIGRTFIDPEPSARRDAVRRKLNPLRENIAGKRLVVVDDSIVRGTTTRSIVKMLRDAGAREVHLRVSSPPFRWPCFYGIDTPTRAELLAANLTIAEMARFFGVESLAFIELAELKQAIGAGEAGWCDACLTGKYPTSVRQAAGERDRRSAGAHDRSAGPDARAPAVGVGAGAAGAMPPGDSAGPGDAGQRALPFP